MLTQEQLEALSLAAVAAVRALDETAAAARKMVRLAYR